MLIICLFQLTWHLILETTPDFLHKELINPLDVDGFCSRIEEYYVSRLKREENNLSEWAVKQFNPEILFNQFYCKF